MSYRYKQGLHIHKPDRREDKTRKRMWTPGTSLQRLCLRFPTVTVEFECDVSLPQQLQEIKKRKYLPNIRETL